MQWGDVVQRHCPQFGREIGGQFPVPFDGLGSQFLLGMLAKELLEQHGECGGERRGNSSGAGLHQLVLLQFLGAALRLGVHRLLLASESYFADQAAFLPSGARRAEDVSSDRRPRFVLALEDRHQFTTTTSGGRRSPAPARRPQVRSQARYACLVMIHRRPRRTPGMIPCSNIAYTARRPMFNRRAISSTDMRLLGESGNPSALDCVLSAMALLAVILVSLRAAEASRGYLRRRCRRNG